MPPRVRIQPKRALTNANSTRTPYICVHCRYASLESATTPAPALEQAVTAAPPIARYPQTQPPSHKPPEFRKTQLHRQYQSLLRSTPLMVIFQHNNLKSNEWMAIRRELSSALQKVDEETAKSGNKELVGAGTRISVVQTGIFASAVRVIEFWDPNFEPQSRTIEPTDPKVASSMPAQDLTGEKLDAALTHGLSERVWRMTRNKKNRGARHNLEPILSGPLAVLTLPAVSPQHLKAALSILAPSKEFPAPKRKANPGYHEPAVQNGLQKLLLLAARVEGRVLDMDGTRWVGGIEGGIDGLRGQLVAMLQGVGAGITSTLEAASKSLYFTVEGRRTMLEDEQKGGKQ
jgi:large subunit ribosomal protein L10